LRDSSQLSEVGDPPVRHYVLTRFDVYLGDQSKYRTDEWFRNRLDLFEQFTWPAIVAQTRQDFTWLVFFHEKSRAEVEQRFADRDLPFVAVFSDELWEPSLVRKAVRSLGAPERSVTVSTQLDCDDAFAADAVARIRSAVAKRPTTRTYLNFPLGYQFAEGRFYLALDPSNPFITLVEPVESLDEALFAYHVCHEDASSHAPVDHIDWEPGWLQVVHGTNISNHTNGLRIRNSKPWGRFRHLPGVGDRRVESRLEVESDRLRGATFLVKKALFRPLGRRRIYRALKIEGVMSKARGATDRAPASAPSESPLAAPAAPVDALEPVEVRR
jgi:Putative rhamnosyl transferase